MDDHRAVTIAHAFGNRLDRLALALAAPVDMVEADVWFHRGRLVVRHERQLGPLPLLFDAKPARTAVTGLGAPALSVGRWYVRLAPAPLALSQVAAQANGRKELMLDLKGRASGVRPAFATALVRFLDDQRLTRRVVVCSDDWELLRLVQALAPDLRVSYSAKSLRQLERIWRAEDTLPLRAVCVRHGLLDEGLVGRLKERRTKVFTWTVDELERARQLQRWGVDGIISNDLALLAALKGP
ncbi:MAG: glycerophosphodiester phosphodiesterase [Dehalococcoidia bacterium]